jgi:hypothetical protein
LQNGNAVLVGITLDRTGRQAPTAACGSVRLRVRGDNRVSCRNERL